MFEGEFCSTPVDHHTCKMYTPVLLLAFLSVSLGIPHDRPMDNPAWREYKLKFGKVYANDHEEKDRYFIWQLNLKEILKHNSKSEAYEQGVNNFTDLTHEEFQQRYGGCYKVPKDILESNDTTGYIFLPPSNVNIPSTVNWVREGYVTYVKNQGDCGSGYAFSATGSLEGQIRKKRGRLRSLSEQNIVDCSSRYGNHGCNGGWMTKVFQYIKDNNGINSENVYPYVGKKRHCKFKPQYIAARVTSFRRIIIGDEAQLQVAVAKFGPIAVAIDASHRSFVSYKSGIYINNSCSRSRLSQAVLIVGYGGQGGHKYWLVKNSWGRHWGDRGYIKMARNRNNQCGIATQAGFPLV